jgi:hypothetical protein
MFTGIHKDLLHTRYLVGLGKILNVDSVVHFSIPALIWPQKGAKSTKIKFQGLYTQCVTMSKNRNSDFLRIHQSFDIHDIFCSSLKGVFTRIFRDKSRCVPRNKMGNSSPQRPQYHLLDLRGRPQCHLPELRGRRKGR